MTVDEIAKAMAEGLPENAVPEEWYAQSCEVLLFEVRRLRAEAGPGVGLRSGRPESVTLAAAEEHAAWLRYSARYAQTTLVGKFVVLLDDEVRRLREIARLRVEQVVDKQPAGRFIVPHNAPVKDVPVDEAMSVIAGFRNSGASPDLYAEAIALALEAEVRRLSEVIGILEDDVRTAAGELLVEMPAPGSPMARVMVANAMMRRERDQANADLRAMCEDWRDYQAGGDGEPPEIVPEMNAIADRVLGKGGER